MRYAQIRSMDISNGENIGVSLFVQGCPHKCHNCFNQETWNPKDGKEFTKEVKQDFFKLIDRDFIKRVTIIGGEPLAPYNYLEVRLLMQEIKNKFPDKTIWLYTGYTYEELTREQYRTIIYVDYLVDGKFVEELKDLSLPFRGSSNQRIINVQKTLEQGDIVLWEDEQ